jgi:hypothetical protein
MLATVAALLAAAVTGRAGGKALAATLPAP